MTTEPVEPENPAAYALARHIADHPVSTVQAAFRYLNAPVTIGQHETAAVPSAPVDRAAILNEAIDRAFKYGESLSSTGDVRIAHGMAAELQRMADEAQQPETQADDKPAVCAGFQWIGQSFATCERCGQPAWDHDGEEVAVEGAGPFDTRRTVRPWKPGQAAAIRAKWAPATADEEGTP